MTRRTLLLAAPLVTRLLRAQDTRPGLSIMWTTGRAVPAEFARESVVFTRAYAGCPDAERSRSVLEHGRFAHALRPTDPSAASFFGTGASTNTITVLTAGSADGGDSAFNSSVHVPLAILWPGRLTPRVDRDLLISHVDILPTLLGMAGIAAPVGLQGRNHSARVLTGRGALADSIYAQGRIGTAGEWRMALRGFDKIVWNLRDEVTGLYNLADDPNEFVNLAGQRAHELTQDSLMALARQWTQRLEDGIDPSGLRLRR